MALHANAWKSNYASESKLSTAESFFKRSHLYVPWKSHTEINQFSNREKDIRGDCYLLEHESSNQLITLRDNEVKKRTWFYQHIHASMCELMEAVKKRLAHGQVRSLSFASQMTAKIPIQAYGSELPTPNGNQAPLPKLYGYAIKSAGWMPWH